MSGMMQGLLTYTQLASILGMLNVEWPSILQGLFKGFSWLTHIAPKVSKLHLAHGPLVMLVLLHDCQQVMKG